LSLPEKGRILPREFYSKATEHVARDLLGKILIRRVGKKFLGGIIVETEAYFGSEDPASRAKRGGDLKRTLYGEVGVALVYGIHTHWMFNAVAHPEGKGGAVLLRAIQPILGIDEMMKIRGCNSIYMVASGPGRLTRALRIDKRFHKKPLYVKRYGLWIEDRGIEIPDSQIARDARIGVSEDLDEPYRFFLKDSPYLSRPPKKK